MLIDKLPSFLFLTVKICKLSDQSFFLELICAAYINPSSNVLSFFEKINILLSTIFSIDITIFSAPFTIKYPPGSNLHSFFIFCLIFVEQYLDLTMIGILAI